MNLKVRHEEGGKLHKMTNFDKPEVHFTGKGGVAKALAKMKNK